MTSNEFHMQLGVEALANDTIWFLRKPCGGTSICNMLQHVRHKLSLGEGTSNGNLILEGNKEHNAIQRVDTLNPSTTHNIAMVNNNSSTSNVEVCQGLNINTQKYGVMPATYVDISSDDEANTNKDKGKKPMKPKRNYHRKRKDINTRVAWTPELHAKFLEALSALGKEEAYPRQILKHMNVPGLTRAQISSHLQRIQEKENYSLKSPAIGPTQKGLNLQAGNYASTPFDKTMHQTVNDSTPPRPFSYNHYGMSYVSLNNIRDALQESRQYLPLTQQIITTINNFDGYHGNEHRSSDEFQLPTSETVPLTQQITSNINNLDGYQGDEHRSSDEFQLPIGDTVPVTQQITTSINNFDGYQGNEHCSIDEFQLPTDEMVPLTQQITTTINNLDGYQGNEYRSSDEFHLPIGDTNTINNFDGDQDNEHRSSDEFQLIPAGETVPMNNAFGLVNQPNEHNFGDSFEPLIGDMSMINSDFSFTANSHNGSDQHMLGDTSMISNDFVFTTNSHGGNDQGGEVISATVETQYNMETNANAFSNGFNNANRVGADGGAVIEDLAPFDRFGIPIGPNVGNGVEASSNVGLGDFMIPVFVLNDPVIVTHPQALLQGRVNFGNNSTNFYGHGDSAMENNNEAQLMQPSMSSNVPLDDSEGTLIDNEWCLRFIHQDQNDSASNNNRSYYGSM
ncbi:hypothetical protein QVD17_31899 [Tagetes erecta]|uniref:HTH myb-type domain-containing protein n=1 Tax=Tagetes erecta TaxID=13708 RepID=A0AAD8K7X4_TARER|nr:hypothetical protein QVD17_31899 [Tagetes erecta]